MRRLSRDQVRQVDRLAIEKLGISGLVLMENAGRQAADVVLELLRDIRRLPPSQARVAVLVGGGNNGGDGYVIARHLHNHGVTVALFAASDPVTLKGDAAVNHGICMKMSLSVRSIISHRHLAAESPAWANAHLIVDALLGTGFVGKVRPHMASVIQRCNALAGPLVVAVDVPSGLDCDTGQPSNATIRAHCTVTFVAQKQGFVAPGASDYTGRVIVADIGAPPTLVERVSNSD